MQATVRSSALSLRSELSDSRVTPAAFNVALEAIPAQDRDEWLDLLWNLDEVPADDPELPRGCVPYLPCPVEIVLDALQQASVTSDDVFVDVGSGAGRAALLAHLATGASCIGLEIQAGLVATSRARADWLRLTQLSFVAGDAADITCFITIGTVFFLYCPFSGARLQQVLEGLHSIARTRPIRVCCVDMPPLDAPWLALLPPISTHVHVYQSTLLP